MYCLRSHNTRRGGSSAQQCVQPSGSIDGPQRKAFLSPQLRIWAATIEARLTTGLLLQTERSLHAGHTAGFTSLSPATIASCGTCPDSAAISTKAMPKEHAAPPPLPALFDSNHNRATPTTLSPHHQQWSTQQQYSPERKASQHAKTTTAALLSLSLSREVRLHQLDVLCLHLHHPPGRIHHQEAGMTRKGGGRRERSTSTRRRRECSMKGHAHFALRM